jgi:hypothetical protein
MVSCNIQDLKGFHCDVKSIAVEANNKEEFYEELEACRTVRLEEIRKALSRTAQGAASSPGTFNHDPVLIGPFVRFSRNNIHFDALINFVHELTKSSERTTLPVRTQITLPEPIPTRLPGGLETYQEGELAKETGVSNDYSQPVRGLDLLRRTPQRKSRSFPATLARDAGVSKRRAGQAGSKTIKKNFRSAPVVRKRPRQPRSTSQGRFDKNMRTSRRIAGLPPECTDDQRLGMVKA